tara:strand:- start:231 stop:644 length:414 start_codon:yes stop_codon:yes gene_type:complete
MKFLQDFKNKNLGGGMLAHHINPNAGAGVENPFAEPSIEQIVEMIESGEAPKDILGESADRIIKEVNERRSRTKINPTDYKMPGEFPGTKEEFNKKYGDEGVDTRPNFMEIPVIPFTGENKDDLTFLQSFMKNKNLS